MNEVELRQHQQISSAAYLLALHERCRRRFVRAARLVGVDLAKLPALSAIGSHNPVDLGPLLPFWNILIERYNKEQFDPQMEVFGEREPQLQRFSEFVHWRLWPLLTAEDECVRNVLRVTGSLPSRDIKAAGAALVNHIANLPLQPDLRPVDVEEIE